MVKPNYDLPRTNKLTNIVKRSTYTSPANLLVSTSTTKVMQSDFYKSFNFLMIEQSWKKAIKNSVLFIARKFSAWYFIYTVKKDPVLLPKQLMRTV